MHSVIWPGEFCLYNSHPAFPAISSTVWIFNFINVLVFLLEDLEQF